VYVCVRVRVYPLLYVLLLCIFLVRLVVSLCLYVFRMPTRRWMRYLCVCVCVCVCGGVVWCVSVHVCVECGIDLVERGAVR
jgi:hypothetical protein